MYVTMAPPKGSKGSPPRSRGTDLIMNIVGKGIPMVKCTGISISSLATTNFLAPKIIGIVLRLLEWFPFYIIIGFVWPILYKRPFLAGTTKIPSFFIGFEHLTLVIGTNLVEYTAITWTPYILSLAIACGIVLVIIPWMVMLPRCLMVVFDSSLFPSLGIDFVFLGTTSLALLNIGWVEIIFTLFGA